jgi:hypothetical protein
MLTTVSGLMLAVILGHARVSQDVLDKLLCGSRIVKT